MPIVFVMFLAEVLREWILACTFLLIGVFYFCSLSFALLGNMFAVFEALRFCKPVAPTALRGTRELTTQRHCNINHALGRDAIHSASAHTLQTKCNNMG